MSRLFICVLLLVSSLYSCGQGLEKVFVEKYYVVDDEDAKSPDARGLKSGMVTYRIWVDLNEDYKLLSVYGAPGHPLRIETSTTFFNDTLHGEVEAPDINPSHLGVNALLLDSYIAFSGANRSDLAVLKSDDTDGSIVKPMIKGQDPVLAERGVLMNQNPEAGIPLRDADGLMDGSVPALVVFGHDFTAFDKTLDQNKIEFDNGAWAVFKGLKGPFPEKNYLLIAQITTDGVLSYELNLQLASPDGATEYYVARNPKEGEFSHPSLQQLSPVQSPTEP